MNQKQAKRLRRAMNADKQSMRNGLPGGVLVEQVHMLWPLLNHQQRGQVSKYTKGTYTFPWRARLHLAPATMRVPRDLERAATVARTLALKELIA